MVKKVIIPVFFCIFLSLATNSYPQYHLSYDYVMGLALGYIKDNNFDDALHYLNIAQEIRPYSQEPVFYINLIKRIREGRVREVTPPIKQKAQYGILRTYPFKRETSSVKRSKASNFLDKFTVEKKAQKKTSEREKTIKHALSLWESRAGCF